MNDRKNVSWILFLCLTTGPLAGCDGADDAGEGVLDLQSTEIDLLPIVSPMGAEMASETELALAAPLTEAVPVQAHSKQKFNKKISPSEELVIGWLNWALGQPNDDGPISDLTGENCAIGQEGPVWYLAGTFGGPVVRQCDVPAGKKLFFPLVNRWCVFPPEFYENDEQIAEVLPAIESWYDAKHAATCELTLKIDGQEVRPDFESLDGDTYIKVMELFELDLHDEHWAEGYFAGGVMPASGDGHYALINPLPPGDHVIEFGGTVCGNYPFTTSATYLLHVGN
jgi:hypothetical protein